MGRGIAQVLAQSGRKTVVFDPSQVHLSAGEAFIQESLKKATAKGKITPEQESTALGLLHFTSKIEDLAKMDLYIEAATEQLEVKKSIFKQLAALSHEQSLFASNTSSISITEMGASMGHAKRFIGMHFMNPVPVMKLVEVIIGLETSSETLEAVKTLATDMGKTVVMAKDYPGFAVNRILMPMINEAIYALYEGVASIADLDQAMKLGTNQPMGPLELADFIGLDTCLSIMNVLHKGFGDSKYRPCPLLIQYVSAGRLGRKTKKGFYEY
jgi:3-hydroxybutyryl-CoA dehydrogenase